MQPMPFSLDLLGLLKLAKKVFIRQTANFNCL